MLNKSDISNFIANSELNTKLAKLVAKVEIKVEQGKRVKLQTYDLSYFPGKSIFGDYGSQNTFVYQTTFSTSQIKNYKYNDYIISWKSKGLSCFFCIASHIPEIKWEYNLIKIL